MNDSAGSDMLATGHMHLYHCLWTEVHVYTVEDLQSHTAQTVQYNFNMHERLYNNDNSRLTKTLDSE